MVASRPDRPQHPPPRADGCEDRGDTYQVVEPLREVRFVTQQNYPGSSWTTDGPIARPPGRCREAVRAGKARRPGLRSRSMSDPRLGDPQRSILHTLAIKGFATPPALANATGMEIGFCP